MRHWWRSYWFMLRWNVLRSRDNLPAWFVIQTMIAVGVSIGLSFLIPHPSRTTALFLCTGSMAVSLVTMGMVMAPQTVVHRKQNGLLDYQRSLPVPRMVLMAADATVWVVIGLPGLILSALVALVRFDLDVTTSPLLIPAVLLVMVGTVAIGYSIAYLVKPVLVGLVTNVVMQIALMFAPINYPPDRLPAWLAAVHQWLPFQYMAQAIRETVDVPSTGVSTLPFVVLAVWAGLGLFAASRTLTRRS